MNAILHQAFGPPEEVLQLAELDTPTPAPDQVLVRVESAALAKGDWLIAMGLPYIARPMYGLARPKAPVAGLHFAGVVAAVGAGVRGFQEGDEVFGTHSGTLADFVVAPEARIAHKPPNVSFDAAAAAAGSGLTALQAVRDAAAAGPGQRLLVIGASGGVGSFAVQIAVALGAEVTGVASTPNLEVVRSLGAHHVIDYRREDLMAHGGGYDVILDLAGNRPIPVLRRALAPRGTLVVVGGTGGRWTMGFGRTIRAMLLSPFVPQQLKGFFTAPRQEDLRELARLMEEGAVTPLVEQRYPLSDAPHAIGLLGSGHGRGTPVVSL